VELILIFGITCQDFKFTKKQYKVIVKLLHCFGIKSIIKIKLYAEMDNQKII